MVTYERPYRKRQIDNSMLEEKVFESELDDMLLKGSSSSDNTD